MTKERLQGHLLILSVNLIFGLNTPISKWMLSEKLDAQLHTILRMIVAGILFWLASLFTAREKVAPKDLFMLFICGMCGIALNQYLFIQGLSTTSPVDASVIVTSTPIFVMIFSAIILREPITSLKTLGVLAGAAGAIWLVISANQSSDANSSVFGDTLALISSFIYSFYFVISKPLAQKYSAITMMKWMFLFAVIALMPLNYKSLIGFSGVKGTIDSTTIAAMFYVFVCATFVTYLLIPMAIKRIRPTTASMYNYVQPIAACAVAVAVGQDEISASKIISAILIFAGVYMVTKSKARRDTIAEVEK